MIIQNEPVSERRGRGHVVHGAARRPARRAPRARAAGRRARASRVATDESIGKVSIVGAGMKTHPGVAAKVFSTLGDERDQHRDDLDLADPDLLRDPRRPGPRRRARAAQPPSSCRAPARSRPSAVRGVRIMTTPRASSWRHRRRRHRRCCACCAARLPGQRGRAVRLRALRGQDARRRRRPSSRSPTTRRRLRHRAVLRRRRRPPASGRRSSSRRRDRRRQLLRLAHGRRRPARRLARSTPTRSTAHRKGIIANPNCTTMVAMLPLKALHDAYGLTRDGRDELPGRRRGGAEGHRRARRPDPGAVAQDVEALLVDAARPPRAGSTHRVHANTLAFNVVPMLGTRGRGRLHRRGAEAPQRVAQDPRHPRPRTSSPTCVRVPVMVGHAIEIRATFERTVGPRRGERGAGGVPEPRRPGGPDAAGVGGPRRDGGRPRPRATWRIRSTR